MLWFLNPFSVIWKHAKAAKEVHKIEDSNLKVLMMVHLLNDLQGATSLPGARQGDDNDLGVIYVCRGMASQWEGFW